MPFGSTGVVVVREYRSSDRQAVISVFERSVREINSRDYSPAQIAAWAPLTADASMWSSRLAQGGVFVCERDDEIVGFARVDDAGCVDLLYVHPDYQRQGVARELIDRLILWASSRGIRLLYAEVSVTARPFFERMGFQIVRPQVVERRGVSFDNFRMERAIDADLHTPADRP
jgi:putative acetyltransferase